MPNFSTYNIMIVEDDLMYSKGISHFVDSNFSVNLEVYNNGVDALARLSKDNYVPDLILLDYDLGDMKGIELLQCMHEMNKKSKVIMLTSQTDLKVVQDLFTAGIFEYLTKGDYVVKCLKESITYLMDEKRNTSAAKSFSLF